MFSYCSVSLEKSLNHVTHKLCFTKQNRKLDYDCAWNLPLFGLQKTFKIICTYLKLGSFNKSKAFYFFLYFIVFWHIILLQQKEEDWYKWMGFNVSQFYRCQIQWLNIDMKFIFYTFLLLISVLLHVFILVQSNNNCSNIAVIITAILQLWMRKL